jgi:hypothetical protein
MGSFIHHPVAVSPELSHGKNAERDAGDADRDYQTIS